MERQGSQNSAFVLSCQDFEIVLSCLSFQDFAFVLDSFGRPEERGIRRAVIFHVHSLDQIHDYLESRVCSLTAHDVLWLKVPKISIPVDMTPS